MKGEAPAASGERERRGKLLPRAPARAILGRNRRAHACAAAARSAACGFTIALAAVVTGGCGGAGQQTTEEAFAGAPVVLISIDTLRSDRLPAYGYTAVETPAIDAFRRDAILFERAYSHYPLTFPSHVSLLTGTLPPDNGARDNVGYRLKEGFAPYLPRVLKDAGYATGAAVSSFVLRGDVGLEQGFDRYDDRFTEGDQERLWGPERFGPDTFEAAKSWLREVAGGRFFLFFHVYEPHLPHDPPEPFRSRYGETYDGEVAAADAVVGQLVAELEALDAYDRALIVLLSDHGEGLDDHLEKSHGVFLYREALQVPLLVKLPGSPHAGATVAAPAQLIDVLPTVTAALGLATPDGVAGTSLLSLLGEGAPAERPLYAETMYPRLHLGWSDLASLISGRYHYIEAPRPELYDLLADPAEKNDILSDNRRVYAQLRDALEPLRKPLEAPAEEDPETAAKLAALGYVAAAAGTGSGPLPDPKDQMARYSETMERAFGYFNLRDFERAAPLLQELVAENPLMTDAWQQLGMSLREVGRLEEALAAFERAMELSRGAAQVAAETGRTLVRLRRFEEARVHADLAAERAPVLARGLRAEIALGEGSLDEALDLSRDPETGEITNPVLRRSLGLALAERGRHAEAIAMLGPLAEERGEPPELNALALVLIEAGRDDEAEPLAQRVLARDSDNAIAHENLGLIALRRGRVAEARQRFERALALNDRLANSWNLLGVVRVRSGDLGGALTAWERAVALDAEQFDALYNLGFTAAQAGRRDQARRALMRYVSTAPPARYGREIAEAKALLRTLGS